MKNKKFPRVILAVSGLLVLMFFLGVGSLLNDSGTTDEVAHIPSGFSYLKYRDFRLNPEHPPLIKILAVVPLLFMNLKFPLDSLPWHEANQWETGWEFIYRSGNNADTMLFWSRIPILLLALLLGFYLYRLTKEVFGEKTALVALFFYSLCPNILAHSRLVTTDLAVAASFFITLYYFYKFIKTPSWKYLAFSGITLGLAQLVKFSNILLLAYLVLLLLVILIIYQKRIAFNFPFSKYFKKEWLKKIYVFGASLILVTIIGYLLVGAAYAFSINNFPKDLQNKIIENSLPGNDLAETRDALYKLTDNSLIRPYAYYYLGLKMVFLRISGGNTTYFLGQTSNQAWWYYYPVSFLIKTPIPILILFIFSIIGFFRIQKSKIKNQNENLKLKIKKFWIRIKDWVNNNFLEFICWTIIIMFFLVGIRSNLNIGLRHILPLYPFLYILCARYFVKIFTNGFRMKSNTTRILLKSIGVVLLVWYAASNFLIFPSYLAYFNELIGGPKNAYKYTVDSNLDWGQDLKRLAFWVEKNNIDKITIDYFGGSVPEYYLGDKVIIWHSKYGKPPSGWFAVSATYYQNSKWYSKVEGIPDYSWLDNRIPDAMIGYSILVYKVN
jgi:4-amino-4-deoxy-L-arabinose transferase-like glycosyltransferase